AEAFIVSASQNPNRKVWRQVGGYDISPILAWSRAKARVGRPPRRRMRVEPALSVPWACSPPKRMKIPRGSGAQAPPPAFGRGFCKVVPRESFVRGRGHTSTPPRETCFGDPGGRGPWVAKGLIHITWHLYCLPWPVTTKSKSSSRSMV